jgi:hypothetical protein
MPKLISKKKSISVSYWPAVHDASRNLYSGGVPTSRLLSELRIDAYPDLRWDEASDEMLATGKTEIHVRGSKRAFKALAAFLLSLNEYKTEDPDYHEHLDEILDSSGNPSVHLVLHSPNDAFRIDADRGREG